LGTDAWATERSFTTFTLSGSANGNPDAGRGGGITTNRAGCCDAADKGFRDRGGGIEIFGSDPGREIASEPHGLAGGILGFAIFSVEFIKEMGVEVLPTVPGFVVVSLAARSRPAELPAL
jgi:hypothetical protein